MNTNHRYPTRGVDPKNESLLHKRTRITAQPPAHKTGKADYPEPAASQSKSSPPHAPSEDPQQLSDARIPKSKHSKKASKTNPRLANSRAAAEPAPVAMPPMAYPPAGYPQVMQPVMPPQQMMGGMYPPQPQAYDPMQTHAQMMKLQQELYTLQMQQMTMYQQPQQPQPGYYAPPMPGYMPMAQPGMPPAMPLQQQPLSQPVQPSEKDDQASESEHESNEVSEEKKVKAPAGKQTPSKKRQISASSSPQSKRKASPQQDPKAKPAAKPKKAPSPKKGPSPQKAKGAAKNEVIKPAPVPKTLPAKDTRQQKSLAKATTLPAEGGKRLTRGTIKGAEPQIQKAQTQKTQKPAKQLPPRREQPVRGIAADSPTKRLLRSQVPSHLQDSKRLFQELPSPTHRRSPVRKSKRAGPVSERELRHSQRLRRVHDSGSKSSKLHGKSSRDNSLEEPASKRQRILDEDEEPKRLTRRKKFEAQTELVMDKVGVENDLKEKDAKSENQIFTDEEEERELEEQLQREREFLQKKKLIEVMDDAKLKDMGMLFGIPDAEVQEMAEKQKAMLQAQKDQEMLFEENPSSQPNQVPLKTERAPSPKKEESEVLEPIPAPVEMKEEEENSHVLIKADLDQSAPTASMTELDKKLHELNQQIKMQQDLLEQQEKVKRDQQLKEHEERERFLKEEQARAEEQARRQKEEREQAEARCKEHQEKLAAIEAQIAYQKELSDKLQQEEEKRKQEEHDRRTKEIQLQRQREEELRIKEEQLRLEQEERLRQEQAAKVHREEQERLQREHEQKQLELQRREEERLRLQKEAEEHRRAEEERLRLQKEAEERLRIQKEAEEHIRAEQEYQRKLEEERRRKEEEALRIKEEKIREYRLEQDRKRLKAQEEELLRREAENRERYARELEAKQRAQEAQVRPGMELPHRFNMVLHLTHVVENAMIFLATRHQVPTFSRIKMYAESEMKKDFTMTHLKQILGAAPNFFNHKWEVVAGRAELSVSFPENIAQIVSDPSPFDVVPSELSLQVPLSQDVLKTRRDLLKKRLMSLAVSQFRAFAQANPQYNLPLVSQLRDWPEGLAFEVPEPKLKDQPVISKQVHQQIVRQAKYGEDLQTAIQTAKDSRVTNAQQNYPMESDFDSEDSEEEDHPDDLRKMGITQATKEAIEKKQLHEQEARERNNDIIEKEAAQRNIKELQQLALQIRQIFTNKMKSSLIFSNLVEQLQNSHTGTFHSRDQLIEKIRTLSRVCPEWITIKTINPQATVVRVSERVAQFQVNSKVQNYFTKKLQSPERQSRSCPPHDRQQEFSSRHSQVERSAGEQQRSQSVYHTQTVQSFSAEDGQHSQVVSKHTTEQMVQGQIQSVSGFQKYTKIEGSSSSGGTYLSGHHQQDEPKKTEEAKVSSNTFMMQSLFGGDRQQQQAPQQQAYGHQSFVQFNQFQNQQNFYDKR